MPYPHSTKTHIHTQKESAKIIIKAGRRGRNLLQVLSTCSKVLAEKGFLSANEKC